MKCEMCEQILQERSIVFSSMPGVKQVCINPKCPDYFEPAAANPPRCGGCKATLIQEAVTEELGAPVMSSRCINPFCPIVACSLCMRLLDQCICKDPAPIASGPYTFNSTEPAYTFTASEPARGHGIKLDTNKTPVFTEFLMQFPDAIELVAWVGDKGSRAPGHVRSGWKSVEDGYHRYSNAFARHILEEARRLTEEEPDSSDPEFDLLFQIATVAWNSMARLQLYVKQNPRVVARAIGERVDSERAV